MKEILIDENQQDKRLDSFLKSYLSNASGGFIYKMLRKKNITLNDKKASGTEKLSKGDSIKIFFSDETFDKFKGSNTAVIAEVSNDNYDKYDVKVIYEDDNIALVSKPPGLLSQKANQKDESLNDWFIHYLLKSRAVTNESLETYKPSICNRLDRNTSGLVICAKSLKGARAMNGLLKDRSLDKYYRTVISGRLDKEVLLKGYLYKDETKNKVDIRNADPGDDRYSYIETKYVPLKYNEKLDETLLEVKLITGKPHQIRAQLASISHPILGDIKYGGEVYKGLKNQLLHSFRLKFPESMPHDFEYLALKEFVADYPPEYKKYYEEV